LADTFNFDHIHPNAKNHIAKLAVAASHCQPLTLRIRMAYLKFPIISLSLAKMGFAT
jgi:hypothetical protein